MSEPSEMINPESDDDSGVGERLTPGPWQWVHTPSVHTLDHPSDAPDEVWDEREPLDEFESFNELRGGDGTTIAMGIWCNDSTGEIGIWNAHNARLIARAPDLLSAAQTIEKLITDFILDKGTDVAPSSDFAVALDELRHVIRRVTE